MEDPMDENKDDNLESRVEIGRKKKQNKNENPRGGSRFWFKKARGNVSK